MNIRSGANPVFFVCRIHLNRQGDPVIIYYHRDNSRWNALFYIAQL